MAVERPQYNLPFVREDGHTTEITQQFLEKLIAEVIRLRSEVDDHEARLVVLEP